MRPRAALVVLTAGVTAMSDAYAQARPRARELGIAPGVLQPGPLNAIIYNSLLRATTVTAKGGTVEAIPLDPLREILARYGIRPR